MLTYQDTVVALKGADRWRKRGGGLQRVVFFVLKHYLLNRIQHGELGQRHYHLINHSLYQYVGTMAASL